MNCKLAFGCARMVGRSRGMSRVLSMMLVLLFVLSAVDAKPNAAKSKKSSATRTGSKKASTKGGDLKAKLAANEGAAAVDKRDLQTAITKFKIAVEADPGYSDYHTQLAAAYRGAGMKRESAESYERSISMMDEPRNKAGGTQYWAAVHVNLGYVYAEGGGQGLYPGAMQKAANAFEAATTLQPTFVEAYTYWGNALQEMKDMPASAKVFSDAIEHFYAPKAKGKADKQADFSLPPDKGAMLYFHLANCKGALGDSNAAMKAYIEATKVNPSFAAAYTNLGTIYQGRKQNELAKAALQQAVKLDAQLAEAYTNLGIALQDLGEGEEAERMTGMAIQLRPDMAAGHNNHGRALENNNKLELALSSYNKALSFSGQQGSVDAFCAKVRAYVSAYSYICVGILLFLCPHTLIYVSAYAYTCVHILLYVSAYSYICVRILQLTRLLRQGVPGALSMRVGHARGRHASGGSEYRAQPPPAIPRQRALRATVPRLRLPAPTRALC